MYLCKVPKEVCLCTTDRYLQNTEFHSVMYKASDVMHPESSGGCASQRVHDHGGLHYHDSVSSASSSPNNHSSIYSNNNNLPDGKIHPKLLADISYNNKQFSSVRVVNSSDSDNRNINNLDNFGGGSNVTRRSRKHRLAQSSSHRFSRPLRSKR